MGKMVGSATNPRALRPVVFPVNADSNSGVSGDQTTVFAAVCSDGGSMAGTEFGCREDVERLLAEKMKGKNRTDYKVESKKVFFLVLYNPNYSFTEFS